MPRPGSAAAQGSASLTWSAGAADSVPTTCTELIAEVTALSPESARSAPSRECPKINEMIAPIMASIIVIMRRRSPAA
ncbi:hypothetical protein [Cryobacterium lyxosi]|uniref:Uncharacterized protein n=1 Tax=Cryobacterium lyxosi TaxID=1259228 RepID=A0A4R8ZII2_9MICO|nr:hypothetical protein [Cryobacterium lyxosi]TFD26464.1 hypothetical protein E3T27_06585 [Cryobacterium lyxosi]